MGAFLSTFSKVWNPRTDMPSLHGKVAIVTGGSQGALGYATIKFLALAGARVYMGARSETKAHKAIEAMYRDNPDLEKDSVVFLKLDLADIKGVVAAADEFKKKESRLDILINNGAMIPENFERTQADFEMIMAVAHIGHFVLVDQLLPLMKMTALQPNTDVRIVSVSSSAHYGMLPRNYSYDFSFPASLTDSGKAPLKGWPVSPHLVRYALAKGANVLFAAELQRRIDKEGCSIMSIAINPGGVVSPGNAQVFYPFLLPIIRLFFVDADRGAVTPLFAATAVQVRDQRDVFAGQYLDPYGKLGITHADMKSEKVALDLWNTTRGEVNAYMLSNGLNILSM